MNSLITLHCGREERSPVHIVGHSNSTTAWTVSVQPGRAWNWWHVLSSQQYWWESFYSSRWEWHQPQRVPSLRAKLVQNVLREIQRRELYDPGTERWIVKVLRQECRSLLPGRSLTRFEFKEHLWEPIRDIAVLKGGLAAVELVNFNCSEPRAWVQRREHCLLTQVVHVVFHVRRMVRVAVCVGILILVIQSEAQQTLRVDGKYNKTQLFGTHWPYYLLEMHPSSLHRVDLP